MLVMKLVPENFSKILNRCKDLDLRTITEVYEEDRQLDDLPRYATPWWSSGSGKFTNYSVLVREDMLDERCEYPRGKSDTDWFQATTRKNS